MPETAATVAALLTEPQKRAVRWLAKAEEPIPAYRRTYSAIAAFNLILPGVTRFVGKIPPGERDFRDHYYLTPFGREVAQFLEETDA